jgi:hypothetical protein
VCFVGQRVLNAYPSALAERSEAYKEGDFVVHFAGCSVRDERVCSREFETMFERAVTAAQLAGVKNVLTSDSPLPAATVNVRRSVRDTLAKLLSIPALGDDKAGDTLVDIRGSLISREQTREGTRVALLVELGVSDSIRECLQREAVAQQYSWFTISFESTAIEIPTHHQFMTQIRCSSMSASESCIARHILQLLPFFDQLFLVAPALNTLHDGSCPGSVEFPLHARLASPLHDIVFWKRGEQAAVFPIREQALLLLSNSIATRQLLRCAAFTPEPAESCSRLVEAADVLAAPLPWAKLLFSSPLTGNLPNDEKKVLSARLLHDAQFAGLSSDDHAKSRRPFFHVMLPVAIAAYFCAAQDRRQLVTAAPRSPMQSSLAESPRERAKGNSIGNFGVDNEFGPLTTEGSTRFNVAIATICPSESWLKVPSRANKQRFASRHGASLYWTECSSTGGEESNICHSLRLDRPPGARRHMRWAKIPALTDAFLQRNGKHDWVLYLEPDVFVTSLGAVPSELLSRLRLITGGAAVDLYLTGESKGTSDVAVILDTAVIAARNCPAVVELLAQWWAVPHEHWAPAQEESALSYLLSTGSKRLPFNSAGAEVFIFEKLNLSWALVQPRGELNHVARSTLNDHDPQNEALFAVQFPFCAYRARAACSNSITRVLRSV